MATVSRNRRPQSTALVRYRSARTPRLPILVVLTLATVALLTGCSSGEPISGEDYLLGTILRVTIQDTGYSQQLLDRVFARVGEIEALMSTTEADYPSTELLELNRASGTAAIPISDDTREVLESALYYSTITDGAFDVTIWPLVRLWDITGEQPFRVPPADAIGEASALVDYSILELREDGSAYLPVAGMGADVGGIAKGYAADVSAAMLREAGVEHALLDFGGNIMVIGAKIDGTPWRIGVQRPDATRNSYIGIVTVADKSVVTSGPYERFQVVDGVRYHHILDPATGYPAESDLEQVTIVSDVSMDADALSTASFVLGLDLALELIEALAGVEAILVTTDREVYVTTGIGDSFRLTDSDFRMADDGR